MADDREERYLAYLESDRWALQRAAALARADYRCKSCGTTLELQVHHLTYDRLGDELPQDLAVLCATCHKRTHERQDARRRYYRRLDGWARKVYGDDWARRFDAMELEDEFDAWLDSKNADPF